MTKIKTTKTTTTKTTTTNATTTKTTITKTNATKTKTEISLMFNLFLFIYMYAVFLSVNTVVHVNIKKYNTTE